MNLKDNSYDVREAYLEQVKPILLQLESKCKELGIPFVACFWTGLIEGNAQVAGLSAPNREQVEDMFVHIASICLGVNPIEAQQSIDSINKIGARFYSVVNEGAYDLYEPIVPSFAAPAANDGAVDA